MKENFIIPLDGFTAGKRDYLWKADKEFFVDFENSDILDANLLVRVSVEKSGSYLGVNIDLDGSVTVACDRCSEDMNLQLTKTILLSIKFGQEPTDAMADLQSGEREVVWLPDNGEDLDLSQVVYDYACLEIPIQHYHEEGLCNPEALKYLVSESEVPTMKQETDTPFAALKGLFEEKI